MDHGSTGRSRAHPSTAGDEVGGGGGGGGGGADAAEVQ